MKTTLQQNVMWIVLSLSISLSPLSVAQGERVISSSDVQRLREFIGNTDLDASRSVANASGSGSPAGTAAVVNGVYVVKAGDTLSEIMSDHLGDTGFNERVLQQVIVSTNKSAFRRGNPHWLMAGASLRLPTAYDVMEYVAPGHGEGVRLATGNDWVRFP